MQKARDFVKKYGASCVKNDDTDDINYDDDLLSEYGDVDEVDDIDDSEGY